MFDESYKRNIIYLRFIFKNAMKMAADTDLPLSDTQAKKYFYSP
jgi:hypothetical protein